MTTFKKLLWRGGAAVGAVAMVGMFVAAGSAYAMVPTFTQAGVTVGLGQTMTVTTQNGVSVYMLSNSAPSLAVVSFNGSQIAITGQALGTAVLNLCAVGTSGDCTNFSVTVQAGTVTGVAFSQNNLSLAPSGTQTVTVSGGNGTYNVSNNANTSIATASISGTTLTLTGVAAGSDTISVCDTANSCATLSLAVSAAASASTSTGGLSFNPSSLSLTSGGSQATIVSGGNGTYRVPVSSNTSAVSATVSGNSINVYALGAGTATVTVCDTANVCGTLPVTSVAPTTGQAVTFNPANPTLSIGQSQNVAVSGGGATSFVVFSNSNDNAVHATMANGLTLSLSAVAAGSDAVVVCAANGGCSTLSVTVTGGAAPSTTTTNTGTTSQTTAATTTTPPPMTQTVTTGSLANAAAILARIQALQSALTQALSQLQSVQSQLNQLALQVGAGTSANVTASAGDSGQFTELLSLGSQDAQVMALQQRLIAGGFLTGSATGYYGVGTQQAVMKYQAAHGLSKTGSVGPSTRAALNAGQ